jgi:hypothetical protein
MNEETNNTLVEKDNAMKTWLVDYVGQKLKPENGEITVEMIVEAMSQEFPDFLMLVAQENWLRGYQQALYDVDYGELSKNEQESTGISE